MLVRVRLALACGQSYASDDSEARLVCLVKFPTNREKLTDEDGVTGLTQG